MLLWVHQKVGKASHNLFCVLTTKAASTMFQPIFVISSKAWILSTTCAFRRSNDLYITTSTPFSDLTLHGLHVACQAQHRSIHIVPALAQTMQDSFRLKMVIYTIITIPPISVPFYEYLWTWFWSNILRNQEVQWRAEHGQKVKRNTVGHQCNS